MADKPKPDEKPVSPHPSENIFPRFDLKEAQDWIRRQNEPYPGKPRDDNKRA